MRRTFPVAVASMLVLSGAGCEMMTGANSGNLSQAEIETLAFGLTGLSTAQIEDGAFVGSSFGSASTSADVASDEVGAHLGRGGGPGVGPGWLNWGPRGLGLHGTTNTTVETTGP